MSDAFGQNTSQAERFSVNIGAKTAVGGLEASTSLVSSTLTAKTTKHNFQRPTRSRVKRHRAHRRIMRIHTKLNALSESARGKPAPVPISQFSFGFGIGLAKQTGGCILKLVTLHIQNNWEIHSIEDFQQRLERNDKIARMEPTDSVFIEQMIKLMAPRLNFQLIAIQSVPRFPADSGST